MFAKNDLFLDDDNDNTPELSQGVRFIPFFLTNRFFRMIPNLPMHTEPLPTPANLSKKTRMNLTMSGPTQNPTHFLPKTTLKNPQAVILNTIPVLIIIL